MIHGFIYMEICLKLMREGPEPFIGRFVFVFMKPPNTAVQFSVGFR